MSDGPRRRTTLAALFVSSFKAGLAFGGGLGILAVLEEEVVRRHRLVGEQEFLAMYGIGRIVPAGTMTALAVAFGYRVAGMLGTIVAVGGLTLPAFAISLAFAIGYDALRTGGLPDLLPVTLLPAALALVLAAGLRLGRRYARLGPELAIVVAAFAGALLLDLNPAIVLIGGGLAAAAIPSLRTAPEERAARSR